MVTAGIFPFKENSHGRARNRTRDLMISSQKLWPLDHEAGHETSFLDRLSKSPQTSNFIKLRPVGAGLFHANGETHTKLIVAYRNVTNVPKK